MAYRWKFKGHRNEYINRKKKYERNLQKWLKSHSSNGIVMWNLSEDRPERPSTVTVSKEHFLFHNLLTVKTMRSRFIWPSRKNR